MIIVMARSSNTLSTAITHIMTFQNWGHLVKILNLYSGLGGNRTEWGGEHDVLAVDINPTLCAFYKNRFSDDQVVCTDAHEYLLQVIRDGKDSKWYPDFIWSSPPCQTHSSFRQNICVRYRGTEPVYPDMKLYQEVLLLRHNFDGLWVVENVNPYYGPLMEPDFRIGRHIFYSNFPVQPVELEPLTEIRKAQIKDLSEAHGISLDGWKIPNKRQVLRNCVDYRIGKHIIDSAKEAMK